MRAVLGRRRTVSRAVPLAATTPTSHSHPHAVGRRRTVRVIVIAMIASLWTSCITNERGKGEVLQRDPFFYTSEQSVRVMSTIIRWVVSQKSGLPLALVGIGIRI